MVRKEGMKFFLKIEKKHSNEWREMDAKVCVYKVAWNFLLKIYDYSKSVVRNISGEY